MIIFIDCFYFIFQIVLLIYNSTNEKCWSKGFYFKKQFIKNYIVQLEEGFKLKKVESNYFKCFKLNKKKLESKN